MIRRSVNRMVIALERKAWWTVSPGTRWPPIAPRSVGWVGSTSRMRMVPLSAGRTRPQYRASGRRRLEMDEAGAVREIRELIADRVEAMRTRDAGRAVASLAPEIVAFELAPP